MPLLSLPADLCLDELAVTTSPPHHILIVEDEPEFVAMLEPVLVRQGFVTTAVTTAEEAMEVAGDVDLVVMDVNLGEGMSGFVACQQLKDRDPSLPVLMLTGSVTEVDELTGLSFGADDYVRKPFSPSVVAARIGALLRRTAAAGPTTSTTVTVGRVSVDLVGRRAEVDGVEVDLTPTEFDLLAALVRADGAAVTHRELFVAVWGGADDYAQHRVMVHMSNLRKKLAAVSSAHGVRSVRGVGYQLGVPAVT